MTEKVRAQVEQLTQALDRIEEALALPPTPINKDATIQRFEFSFELAWKLLQSIARQEGQDVYGPRDSLRVALQLGLIEDIEQWLAFQDARNLSTHTYNESIANEVYEQVKLFLLAARKLVEKVSKRD